MILCLLTVLAVVLATPTLLMAARVDTTDGGLTADSLRTLNELDSTLLERRLGGSTYVGVGVQAGIATTTGLSLRLALSGRSCFEVNGMALTGSTPSGAIDIAFWCIGFEFQHAFYTGRHHRFYFMAGVGLIPEFSFTGHGGQDAFAFPIPSYGAGYELFLFERMSVTAELPVMFLVVPFPQIQLLYYF